MKDGEIMGGDKKHHKSIMFSLRIKKIKVVVA